MKKESFGHKLLRVMGMTMDEAPEEEAAPGVQLVAPLSGTIVAIENVKDDAFNSLAMGNGCAIDPEVGEVYAPCDGVISVVPDTLHAVGITANNGADILIHVGMDTVGLKGKGFEMLVKEDQPVKQGDLLLKFDIPTIKAAGLPVVTPVVVNNSDEYPNFKIIPAEGTTVKTGDKLIEASK